MILCLLVIFFAVVAKVEGRIRADAKPNMVVILSDDAGFEEFGIYDVKQGIASNTPNVDPLAERGVVFANCWGQSICAPSRAMFITGNYAVHTGSYDNTLGFLPGHAGRIKTPQTLDRLPHFTRILQDAGYRVVVSGKWHNPSGPMMIDASGMLGVDTYCAWDSSPEPFEKRLGKKLIPDDTWETAAISGEQKISRYWKPGRFMADHPNFRKPFPAPRIHVFLGSKRLDWKRVVVP